LGFLERRRVKKRFGFRGFTLVELMVVGNTLLWNTPTWSALTFQINDEVYFQYSFDSNGSVRNQAQATANAHADLECDATYSTFQRLMFGDPSAANQYVECSQLGSSAFFVDNETE